MRDRYLLATIVVAATCVASAAQAAPRSAEELNALASLRFQSAQTDVVSARISDAKIVALRQQVALGEALTALEAWRAAGARFDGGDEMISEVNSHLPAARTTGDAPNGGPPK